MATAPHTVTEQIEVRNRWTNRVQFTAEITCAPDATIGVKLGLAVRWGYRNDADLRDADLRDADLSGADLRGAVLRDADLSGADLRDAVLRDADLSDAPKIERIHQQVYAAASQPGALNMDKWHCGTSHCRAGWVIMLAGEEGERLERRIGTPAAATLIYLASDPHIERFPNFYTTNANALNDMRQMAEAEAARSQAA